MRRMRFRASAVERPEMQGMSKGPGPASRPDGVRPATDRGHGISGKPAKDLRVGSRGPRNRGRPIASRLRTRIATPGF